MAFFADWMNFKPFNLSITVPFLLVHHISQNALLWLIIMYFQTWPLDILAAMCPLAFSKEHTQTQCWQPYDFPASNRSKKNRTSPALIGRIADVLHRRGLGLAIMCQHLQYGRLPYGFVSLIPVQFSCHHTVQFCQRGRQREETGLLKQRTRKCHVIGVITLGPLFWSSSWVTVVSRSPNVGEEKEWGEGKILQQHLKHRYSDQHVAAPEHCLCINQLIKQHIKIPDARPK